MASFDYESYITDIPDYPEPGVVFKDITPLFADAEAMRRTVMIGVPVALELGAGFIPARKPGKLPRETYAVSYELEYGTDTLEIHRDAIQPGDRVLIVDDLIATGGTVAATGKLVQDVSGVLVGYACILELTFLEPRKALAAAGDQELYSLVKVQ